MPEEQVPELATSLAAQSDAEKLLEAEAFVRSLCGWHVAPERAGDVVTVDGSGTDLLFLPTLHLTAVTSVIENGNAVDLDDVEHSQAGMLKRRGGRCWTDRLGGVVVTMTHGHSPVPADLAGVVRSLASREADGRTLKAKTTGPFSETYADADLTIDERGIIDRYRIPSVG